MKISLKAEKDMLVIMLDEERAFSEQYDELKVYLSKMKSFLSNGDMKITYKGLELTYEEELSLCALADDAFGRKVNFCYKTQVPDDVLRHIMSNGEVFLKKVYGVVRAGECLRSNGDLLVFGDVNPTASLIATGDIFVIGNLKGSAFAGCNGNKNAVIYAKNMQPENLRIASVAGYASSCFKCVENSIAMVDNDAIVLKMM